MMVETMKYKFGVFLLLAACLFYFGEKTKAQKPGKTEDEVLQILKKYDDAWNKKDSATVAGILASGYVYFTSNGGVWLRQQTLELLNSPKYNLTFAERGEIKIYPTGKTVIVGSRWKGKGTYDTEEINDDQRCSLVFGKEGRQWKLLSEHCTQIVSK